MSKNLETDKQTMEDLNIHVKYKSNSIYSLFNRVVTRRKVIGTNVSPSAFQCR